MTGRKDDEGKVRFELLPPAALYEIAAVLTHGAEKYGDWNWSRGMRAGRLFAAALGHMLTWWSGCDDDEETGRHHLAHAVCSLIFIMEMSRMEQPPAGWEDDRPLFLRAVRSRSKDDAP